MPSIRVRPVTTNLARRGIPRTTCHRFSISTRTARNNASSNRTLENEGVDVARLLERPTWSIASLLSEGKNEANEESEITPAQLRHLLRLSALPFPKSPEEQTAKLKALRTQLHFVRDIQRLDTDGILPLQAIRDETHRALKGQTIGVKEVEQTLLQEELFGHNRRPRRRKNEVDASGIAAWDVLEMASQKAGRYIVVNDAR